MVTGDGIPLLQHSSTTTELLPKHLKLHEGGGPAPDCDSIPALDAKATDSAQPAATSIGGARSIGFFSSMCLLYGNITGPGMVQIPSAFQAAGWLIPTLLFVGVSALSGFVSLYLAKAISLFPNNRGFRQRVEFNEVARALFPRWLYAATMILIVFNLMASNVSAVVESAQTMDSTLLAVFKKTCGIYFHPLQAPGCVSADAAASGSDSAFGGSYVLSLGYAVVLAITIPLGLLNLEDNMWVQQAGFLALTACVLLWTVQFFITGLDPSRMPMVQTASSAAGGSSSAGLTSILSTVIFNYGFVTTVPSWLAEKGPRVSVSRSVWASIVIGTAQFLIIGLLGGYSLDFSAGNDILSVLTDPTVPGILLSSKIAAFVFPLAALLSGIPVYSIVIRYNLLQVNVPKVWANLFAVVLPWGIALFFFSGNLLAALINWSSAILFVALNFLLPVCVYIIYRRAQIHHERYHVPHAAAAQGSECVHGHGYGHGHGDAHAHGHTQGAVQGHEARGAGVRGVVAAGQPPAVALKPAGKHAAEYGEGVGSSLREHLLAPESLAPGAAGSLPSPTAPHVAVGSGGSLNVGGGGDIRLTIRRPLDATLGALASQAPVGASPGCAHLAAAAGPSPPASSPASVAGRMRALLMRSDSEVEHAVEALAAAHEHDQESLPGRRASLENALAVTSVFEQLVALPGHPDACPLHGHLLLGAGHAHTGTGVGGAGTPSPLPGVPASAPLLHAHATGVECTCDRGMASGAPTACGSVSAGGSPPCDGAGLGTHGHAATGSEEQDVSDRELVPCCRRLHCLREPMNLAYALAALSALLAVACFALQVVSVSA